MAIRYEEPEDHVEADVEEDVTVDVGVESVEVGYVETPFGPSTVIAALDQIENLVELARAVPLSANIVLNKAEIIDLVAQAKNALPDDLVAANAVVTDADAVLIRADSAAEAAVAEASAKASTMLEEARNKADTMVTEAKDEALRTVERGREEAHMTEKRATEEAERQLMEAREQVKQMVSEDNVTQLAEHRAREIMAATNEEAASLREGADRYVAQSLGKLASTLAHLQKTTDAGLQKVNRRQKQAEEAANIELD